jgi:hypothetical protein
MEKHYAASILFVCYGKSQCSLNMLWRGITQPVFSAVCSITKPAFSPVCYGSIAHLRFSILCYEEAEDSWEFSVSYSGEALCSLYSFLYRMLYRITMQPEYSPVPYVMERHNAAGILRCMYHNKACILSRLLWKHSTSR